MSKTVFEAIAASNFIANESQVEALAALVATGVQSRGTYLKVLCAHAQSTVGARKLTKPAALAIVDESHDKLYLSVLKGVGDDSVTLAERNRRGIFARSAASTLRKYVMSGGDVRKIDVPTISKAKLRDYGRRVPVGTRAQRSLQRSTDAVLRAARMLARKSPEEARKQLEAVRDKIEEALNAVRQVKPAPRRAHAHRQPVRASRRRSDGATVSPPGAMH